MATAQRRNPPMSLETGHVPVEPISRIMQDYVRRTGETREELGEYLGLTGDYTYRIIANRAWSPWLKFDLADHILCKIGEVQAWILDDELAVIYREVNLAYIDARRPCVNGPEKRPRVAFKIPEKTIKRAIALRAKGKSWQQVGDAVGVKRKSIESACRRYKTAAA